MPLFEPGKPTPVRQWYFKAVWVGVFMTYAQYGLIAYFATRQNNPTPEMDKLIPILFTSLATVSLIAGVSLKKYFFSQSYARRYFEKLEDNSSTHFPGMPPDDQMMDNLISSLFTPYLMCLGMINTCTIFGMMLALLSRNLYIYTPFLIGAVIGTALCYPRINEFIEESRMA